MTEKKTFVSDDPDLEAKPFAITLEYRKFTGAEDAETGLRPSERVSEEFRFRPFVNAGVLVWIDAMGGRKVNPGDMSPVFDLFDASIIAADLPRFRAIIDSPDTYVTGKVLGEIASYLYEVYTARPTQPPAGT